MKPKLYLKIADYADELGLNVTEFVKHIIIERVDPGILKKNEEKKEKAYSQKMKHMK